jgi:hypothetical protein
MKYVLIKSEGGGKWGRGESRNLTRGRKWGQKGRGGDKKVVVVE